MSNVPYLGESTDLVLGQEFLTWLWFRSDTKPIFINPQDSREFQVSMEQRIVVQGGEGDALETASVSGVMSELREARLGLTTGKKVTRALVRLVVSRRVASDIESCGFFIGKFENSHSRKG